VGLVVMEGEQPDRLLTVAETAEMLGLKPSTIRKLVARREIPVVRPTGRRAIRFRLSDIVAIVNRREGGEG
jgi:excisionase family DNA binding protein